MKKNINFVPSNYSILLVEDERIIALKEIEILTTFGFKIFHAPDALTAWHYIDTQHIDLILMDIILKEDNGLDLAFNILQKFNLPIIFLTNYDHPEIVHRIEKIPSYGYILKDSGENILFASIKIALKLFETQKELKQNENELLENKALFSSILEHLPTDFWARDNSGKVILQSKVSLETWGNITGTVIEENDVPGTTKVKWLENNALAYTGKVVKSEYQEKLPDNSTRTVHSVVSPYRVKGEISGIIGMNLDITETKNAYLALAESEKSLKALNETLESRLLALTKPLSEESVYNINDIFNIDELQKIQDAFAEATGVASLITDPQGNAITKPSNTSFLCENVIKKTEAGLANCLYSDGINGRIYKDGPISHKCLNAGLWDAGTSIFVGDNHLANWLIGQVADETTDIETIREYCLSIGALSSDIDYGLSILRKMPAEQFKKITKALDLITSQMSKLAVQNVQQARFITDLKTIEEELTNANNY